MRHGNGLTMFGYEGFIGDGESTICDVASKDEVCPMHREGAFRKMLAGISSSSPSALVSPGRPVRAPGAAYCQRSPNRTTRLRSPEVLERDLYRLISVSVDFEDEA